MPYYMEPNLQLQAGGNIRPSRVVKLSTVTDNTVLEGTTSVAINIGIAQQGTREAPLSGLDDGFAAISGENLGVYGPGSGQAPVQLGGTVTRADAVTSTTDGTAITTTTDADFIVGVALQSGVTGDLVTIIVLPGFRTQ